MRIGACQTAEVLGNIPAAVACMEAFARQPGADTLDLLLFPECFLQGYLVQSDHLNRHGLDLSATPFLKLLDRIRQIISLRF